MFQRFGRSLFGAGLIFALGLMFGEIVAPKAAVASGCEYSQCYVSTDPEQSTYCEFSLNETTCSLNTDPDDTVCDTGMCEPSPE